jgi:hypothetical protein
MALEDKSETDHFSLIFGEAALLKGECRLAYDLLRADIAILLNADDDVLSQLRVQEITDSIWEGRRFKRLGTQTIETSLVTALHYLLQPACATPGRRADLLAYDYYFGEPQDQKLAKEIAAKLGITSERIWGQAIAMSGEFRLFDRLVENRATMLKGLLKDHERQLRKAEKRKAAAARQGEPARVNDNSAPVKKDAA